MCEASVFISSEIPRMKDLDELLRCGICYDYMKTSMITSCSHTYCSLCIRKSLTYKTQCPACFEEAFDYQLRNNRILDSIIEVFVRLSDEFNMLMQSYRKLSECQNKVNTIPSLIQNSNCISDVREGNNVNKGNGNNVSSDQKDLAKLSESTDIPVASSYLHKSENIMSEIDLSVDCDYGRLQNVASVKQPHQSPDHKGMLSKDDAVIPSIFTPRKSSNTTDSLVPCPVCNSDIPARNINIHLDACLMRSQHSGEHSSVTKIQKRKPLPKLVYALLQEKELRRLLKQKGLSTHGDRKALISRHQRFTLLYNSESDTLNPRSNSELIKQIEREEQEEKACSVATTSNNLKIDRKTDPKLIEQAHQQYIQQNKTSFENLIDSIKKREAEKKTAIKQNLVVNDEEDDSVRVPIDSVQNACVQKAAMEDCVIGTEEGDAMQSGYELRDPSVTMSAMNQTTAISNVEDNVNYDENIKERTCDMSYEGDTDEALSPVLVRNTGTSSTRVKKEKRSEGEPTQNSKPDVSERSLFRSSAQKCISLIPQSKEVETGESSDAMGNQTLSLLAEDTQETTLKNNQQSIAYETDERLAARRMHKRLNSQLDDSDFESNSEDMLRDFEIRETHIRRRRKNTRKSPQPSSSTGGRIIRKRVKH